jgi:malate dehydrogenase (oxaloacetate-decarboxylating)(NADP+)
VRFFYVADYVVVGCAILGVGSAGLGVCSQILDGMVEAGISREQALSQFVVCSSKGAVGAKTGKYGDPNHARGLHKDNGLTWLNPKVADGTPMLEVMKEFKPTVLLGLSTQPNIFNEELIRTMAAQCSRPIIMPMSNPTSKSECSPEQAYNWTDGRAIVATGSPFAPVTLKDGRVLIPSQCNNMYIFPGIGLAMSVAGMTKVTDTMLYAASVAAAKTLNAEELKEGRTFPRINRIRDVSHAVACGVIEQGMKEGLATKITARHLQEGISSLVSRKMYFPTYVPLM